MKSGRIKYGRVPYDTYPDTPPVHRRGTTNSGEPCRNWAVLSQQFCRHHGGGHRKLMRPPGRVKACPIGHVHRWGCKGCLGYDALQARKHPATTTKPVVKLDWKGMPVGPNG
jgi:hypothetical protein